MTKSNSPSNITEPDLVEREDIVRKLAPIVFEAMRWAARQGEANPPQWYNGNSYAEDKAREAVRDMLALSPRPSIDREVVEALERAAENFERLTVPHIVGHDVHNFAFQAAKLARAALAKVNGNG